MEIFSSVTLKKNTFVWENTINLFFRMTELGIARDGGSVCFGQLLGMCDHVSLTLGKYHHLLLIYKK